MTPLSGRYATPFRPRLATDSGTMLSFGRLSVHAWQEYVAPFPQYVTATLLREKCVLWGFWCSWLTIGANAYANPSARLADTDANSACLWEKSWYRGLGFHQTWFPEGVGSLKTSSYDVFLRCL